MLVFKSKPVGDFTLVPHKDVRQTLQVLSQHEMYAETALSLLSRKDIACPSGILDPFVQLVLEPFPVDVRW